MKKTILILTVLLLSGCYCRTCRAQALDDRGPFAGSTRVVNATSCVEWVRIHSDLGVPREIAEHVWTHITGTAFIPDDSAATATLTAQRWGLACNLEQVGGAQ